jgi:hypothetical protein
VPDGRDSVATTGDRIGLPMNISHGSFNKSDQGACSVAAVRITVTCRAMEGHPHASI